MQLRPVEKGLLITATAAGLIAPPGMLSGDTSYMLATFLGLISASILPTATLLLGSMTAGGRSVLALGRLHSELRGAMEALILIFICVLGAIAALVSLTMAAPASLTSIPYLTTDILPRAGQMIATACLMFTILRIWQIPAILLRSLTIRHEIAVDEARQQTFDKAPAPQEIKAAFASHPHFGQSVDLHGIPLPER